MVEALHPHWEGIWHPYKAMESHYNEGSYISLTERKIKVWNSFAIVEIGESIDWDMDPFDNKTWGLYFNSLNWLYSLYWGYDQDVESYQRMHDIVVDYCRYLEGDDVNEMAWFDHSTSDRLCFLSTLFRHPMFLEFPSKSRDLIVNTAFLHISKIREFYDTKFWFNSNHGVFHALAILNVAQVAPFSKSDYGLELFGAQYLEVSLKGIISIKDAFTLEQSIYYHQLALNLLETIPDSMFEKTSFNADLTQLIPRMINSNYWVTTDGKRMLPLGDTAYNANIPAAYAPLENPNTKLREFAECGFSIYKSMDSTGKYDVVSFLHPPQRGPHGHFDALSITISHKNTPIVIDSGGPYKYGDPFRFTYFMSNRAHNNIMVNKKIHQSGSEEVSHSNPSQGVFHLQASHRGYNPFKVGRELFIFEGKGVLVIDRITGVEAPFNFDSLWHFAPDCEIEVLGNCLIARISDLILPVYASNFGELNIEMISALEGSNPQGWISDGIGRRHPVPTLVASLNADSDTTMALFFSFEEKSDFELTETEFSIKRSGETNIVKFDDGSGKSSFEIRSSS